MPPSSTPNATHPGSAPHPADVAAALAAALAVLPATYAPRTRHYNGTEHPSTAGDTHPNPYAPAGSHPVFTNRLLLENSPYLRQHAHNPVDWRPWGKAAFDEARRLGRPIFLSIGYSTCHWCHVMEHESFEDLEVATELNRRYVPVKVDREERPDVDAVHMAAVQAMTGSGGWPMSVWLAPDPEAPDGVRGLPYFAGTYFPARDGGRGARMGFLTLLRRLAEAHGSDPAKVLEQGRSVAVAIAAHLGADAPGDPPGVEAVDAAVAEVLATYDSANGGRRWAPKFPSQVPLSLLVRHHLRTGEAASLHAARHTLERMAMGGLYDHVGGGFHRYSTDARWFAPHFEKMLYDQALIVMGALDVLAVASDRLLDHAVRGTLDGLLRDMRHADGGFFSATDADSEGREGLFFLWTAGELTSTLGDDDGALVQRAFGATPRGNFEGSNILHLQAPLAELALREGGDEARLAQRLWSALDRLHAVRRGRVPPLRDDKVLLAWNGLAIAALARAGSQLGEPRWLESAEQAADFVLRQMRTPGGRLLRTWLDGTGKGHGGLDDHAFLVQALLDLFEATQQGRWLQAAIEVHAVQDAHFADSRGGYFATPDDAEVLLAREKPDRDGAEPSGNSVAAFNLVRLHALTAVDAYRVRLDGLLRAFGGRLRDHPGALSEMLLAVEARAGPMREVVLVRPQGSSAAVLAPWRSALRGAFVPHKVVLEIEAGSAAAKVLEEMAPIVAGKDARGGKPTAYVCRAGVCQLPVTEPAAMLGQLRDRPR
ncbi:MAG: thioredoxin domain-containing protein [Myxococcales bacterium]|nr:thioredoxin domain-containing protein [Myxococcales bacterium]